MALLLLVVLLTAGVSLNDAQEDSFRKLPEIYKKGVELALHQINEHDGIQNHFLFFKTIHQAEIKVTVFFSFSFLSSFQGKKKILKLPAISAICLGYY